MYIMRRFDVGNFNKIPLDGYTLRVLFLCTCTNEKCVK